MPTGYIAQTNPIKNTKQTVTIKKIIVIDPGHGDHHDSNKQVDPGSVNGTNYEKDIVLKIGNAAASKIKLEGYEVIQTRVGDIKNAGKRIKWRLDKAKGADLFISIHINSINNASARGFEVFYKKGSEKSKSLAESIRAQNHLFQDRGISVGNFYKVLNGFPEIAVLIEAGFISNSEDLKILTSKANEIGEQIAKGIIDYLKK